MNFILGNIGVFIAPILFLFVYYFGKHLHKHQNIYEFGALVAALFVYLIQLDFIGIDLNLILGGHLSLAFFLLVMFAGVLKKNSKAKKALSLVRAELAIIGFIILIPHGLTRLDLALTGYNVTGLFAFIIFVPLIFTSFMNIRKKMNPKNWKQLHILAYFAYFFIYIHLAFNFSINPDFGFFVQDLDALLYHFILFLYILLRIIFVAIPKVKKKKTKLNSKRT
jgi:DMSO/TMAO reductase YedYZ heme-binding membrane subunit